VVRQGYDLNAPTITSPGGAGTRSLFSVDAPSVVIDTVKPAEGGSEDVIVRLYEAMQKSVTCQLATSLPVQGVEETDMLERSGAPLACDGGQVTLSFRPFEVKTLRIRL
jgi:alpha-mannosidase